MSLDTGLQLREKLTGQPLAPEGRAKFESNFAALQKHTSRKRKKPSLGKSLLGGALGGVESLLGR